MDTIRLSLTPKLKKVIEFLEEDSVILERTEVVKVAILGYYRMRLKEREMTLDEKIKNWSDSLPVRDATPREAKAIMKAEEDVKAGRVTSVTYDEIDDYLKSLTNE